MRGSLLAVAAAWGAASSPVAVAQSRVPLPLAVDSSGVLSAIRAIDVRQLCRCRVVMLDSIVRRSAKVTMYEIVFQPAAFPLRAADRSRLGLAGHRVVGTALRSMTRIGRDTAFMAVQIVSGRPGRQVVVSVSPPSGRTAAFLVSLTPHRNSWRITGYQSVYDP